MKFNKKAISTGIAVAIVVIIVVAAAIGYAVIALSTPTSTTPTTTTTSAPPTTTTTSAPPTTTTTSAISYISTEPITIAVDVPGQTIGATMFAIAIDQKIVQKYDPNAVVLPVGSDQPDLQALLANKAQMAIITAPSVVKAYDAGDNITIVADNLPSLPYSLLVSASSNYTNPSQLKNAHFSTGAIGQIGWLVETVYAAKMGLGNITFTSFKSVDQIPTAVIAGQAAACMVSITNALTIPKTYVSILDNFSTGWPNQMYVTTPGYAASHPDAIKAVLTGLFEASAITVANENNVTLNLELSEFPNIPYSAAVALVKINAFSSTGAFTVSSVQQTINDLYQYNIISKNFSADQIITKGFAPITP